MPRRTRAQLACDKARKQVQNLFDKFKDPVRHLTVYGGYLLQFDGQTFLDDNDLTRLQVKLLPFDVSDTAIPNSAPSFFKPWPVSKLEGHPVDVKAMEGDGLEALEIGNPFPNPSDPIYSARNIQEFIDGQYYHVPRANLGPDSFERLCDHSKWHRVSWVTLLVTLAGLVLIRISYSLPHALLEYDQGIHPYPLAPSTSPWKTLDISEYGYDAPTPPHIIATTISGVEGNNTQLLRGELISILQLMVNRMGEEGHESDAIVPVSPIQKATTRPIPDTNQVLMFSIMSARGRLLQAYSDGEHLVIQMTELLKVEDGNSPFINHAFRYLMSEAVGDTSGLSDVLGIKAAV
jgi:hypothetical protein